MDAPPAMWRHISAVYAAMEKDTDGNQVWSGFLSRLMFTELQIPVPYYGRITQLLKDMGCIVQLQRGGNTSPSKWRLLERPTFEKFEAISGTHPKTKERYARLAALEDRMDALVSQYAGMDIKKMLFALQSQIDQLKETAHGH